jgi:hypothetical protein
MLERVNAYNDEELRLRMMVAAQHDAPAYIRRARAVEAELESILARCRQRRTEWLFGVRVHLGSLRAGVRSWADLRALLSDDNQLLTLTQLRDEAGDPEFPMTGPTAVGGRRRALRLLQTSIERFNRRWLGFIQKFDLSELNRLRDGYNRYFLLEKECAVGAARLLPQTFRRLPPFTNANLLECLPALDVPRLAD